jgi:hypothetical protein
VAADAGATCPSPAKVTDAPCWIARFKHAPSSPNSLHESAYLFQYRLYAAEVPRPA